MMSSSPDKPRPQTDEESQGVPDELITEVLSFADVKTLMQMRCLSKSWESKISDPEFVKLHFKRSVRNPQLTLSLSEFKPDGDNTVVPFPVSRLIENPLITLPDDPCYRLKDNECRYVIGSCNGWLCMLGYHSSIDANRQLWLRFWNPSVRRMSQKLGYCWDNGLGLYTHFKFGFGYDNSAKTYKVVMLRLDEAVKRTHVQVLSLAHNVWRTIQNFPAVPLPFCYTNPGVNDGVYLNGSLNWLALNNSFRYNGVYGWKSINVKQFVIISLDLGSETYKQLMPPYAFDEMSPVEPSICILMDKLCFSNDHRRTHFVIWNMEEFGVEDSWTQLFKISYQNLQSIHHDLVDLQYSQWLPLHLSNHGDTLILANKLEKQAILYNFRDNRAVRTRLTDEIQWFSAKVYVESLVSDIWNNLVIFFLV